MSHPRTIRFDGWVLHIDSGDLEKDGRKIRLQDQPLQILEQLLNRPGELVTREQLIARLWPKGVVDFDTGLNSAMRKLRNALQDDVETPRYIETVPRKGYRFIAAIDLPEAKPVDVSTVAPASPRRNRLALIGALVILGAAGAVLLTTYYAKRQSAEPVASSTAANALPPHTVAVLPFRNLSAEAEKDSELIAFGVAEGLLHRLASMRDLTLIARSSSYAAATPSADARAIGRSLNARYLIEGSVQRSGKRLRIMTQLIDATSGAHVWSLQFDRTVDDIFAVEDEITQNVAQALQVTLAETHHPYARFGTDAYLSLLQGRALVASRKPADVEQAIKRFERAIEIAPDFALAYVDLAYAYITEARLRTSFLSDAIRDAVERGRPLAAKALQLDATLGEAYVLRGFIEWFDGDAARAEVDFRKGLQLAPSYGPGYEQFSEFLQVDRRRFDEALAVIDRARVVDPLRPRIHYMKGRMLADVGSFKEAERLYLRALEIAPDYYPALLRLGEIREESGLFAEAIRLAERAAAIEPAVGWVPFTLAEFYLDIGEVDAARAVLANQSDDLQWTSVCMFEGKTERAAAIFATLPIEQETVDSYEDEFLPFSLRDAAVLRARWERARTRPPSAELWATRIAFAKLQITRGNRSEAQQLARDLLKIDEPHAAHGIEYARPYAYVLLGDKDAAILTLEQNMKRGYLRRWWYTFEREPLLQSFLGKDPRFQSLAARVRQHAASQRTLLQQMRDRGEVPSRKPDPTARSSC
jgi:TolB-like protein/DNA-binding winged helix-turn-helix (wHTH) protein/Tfp pilus assembly protein PilF